MKKFLSIILAILMIVTTMPMAFAAGAFGDLDGDPVECEHFSVMNAVDNGDGTHSGICTDCFESVTATCQYYINGYNDTHHYYTCTLNVSAAAVKQIP